MSCYNEIHQTSGRPAGQPERRMEADDGESRARMGARNGRTIGWPLSPAEEPPPHPPLRSLASDLHGGPTT